jgi:cystathionine beta-lyase/cystathionine gamma-synthase
MMKEPDRLKFATRAIHAGQEPEAATGAVNVPVYLTSTFKQDGVGKLRGGYEYSRTGNPSRASLEETLASLENARYGLCFASGSAATAAVLDLLAPGDEVLTTIDVYGGTYRLFRRVYARYGIEFRFLPAGWAEEIARAITGRTRLVWIESPTNPLLNVIDIAALAASRPPAVLLAVDNTFATPYWQTPLDLGADLVVHSTTKYLGGHSDVVGGAVLTRSEELHRACRFYQNAAGAVPSPFDCFLIQRGVKTLAVRMEAHQANAFEVARRLAAHPKVGQVFFPGLPGHPGYEIARRQMRGQAGMVSVRVAGGRAAAERFLSRLEIFTLAESLGGVESLACYPFTMTHGAIPAEEKERIGITEDLVRLSVGLEAAEDLVGDLEQALA